MLKSFPCIPRSFSRPPRRAMPILTRSMKERNQRMKIGGRHLASIFRRSFRTVVASYPTSVATLPSDVDWQDFSLEATTDMTRLDLMSGIVVDKLTENDIPYKSKKDGSYIHGLKSTTEELVQHSSEEIGLIIYQRCFGHYLEANLRASDWSCPGPLENPGSSDYCHLLYRMGAIRGGSSAPSRPATKTISIPRGMRQ